MMIIAFDHFIDTSHELLDWLGNAPCQPDSHTSGQGKHYAIEQQELLESLLDFSAGMGQRETETDGTPFAWALGSKEGNRNIIAPDCQGRRGDFLDKGAF